MTSFLLKAQYRGGNYASLPPPIVEHALSSASIERIFQRATTPSAMSSNSNTKPQMPSTTIDLPLLTPALKDYIETLKAKWDIAGIGITLAALPTHEDGRFRSETACFGSKDQGGTALRPDVRLSVSLDHLVAPYAPVLLVAWCKHRTTLLTPC